MAQMNVMAQSLCSGELFFFASHRNGEQHRSSGVWKSQGDVAKIPKLSMFIPQLSVKENVEKLAPF